MKKLLPMLGFAIMACSSKTPVDMDEVLFERGGQYITTKGYNTSILGFLYNEKVYNGPGFLNIGMEKRENKVHLKTGFGLEFGQVGTMKVKRSSLANIR